MSSSLALVLRHRHQLSFGGSNAVKFMRLINGSCGGNDIRLVSITTPICLSRFYSNCGSSGGSGSKLIDSFEKSVIQIGGYQWRSGGMGCACEMTIIRGFQTCGVYQYAQVS